MSKKLALIAGVFLMLTSASESAFAQTCALAGSSMWYDMLKGVLADCENNIFAPNGQLTLNISAQGTVRVLETPTGKVLAAASHGIDPPASASWSPNSDGFFINDGEGSGETSALRLYMFRNGHLSLTDRMQEQVVSVYRKRVFCGNAALDPDVWGLRWTPDGGYIELLVRPTIHRPCGDVGTFLGMRVRVSDLTVVEVLPQRITVQRWSLWLPRELRAHENGGA